MRGWFAVSLVAALSTGACASRDTMRAMQTPSPAPHGMVRFENEHRYRDAVVVEWIGGVSQRSYLFAEPNQRVIRPILQDALDNSGLAAGTSVRSQYGLRVFVSNVNGPELGADFDSEMVATYTLINRQTGREIWQQEIRTPGVGYFLSFNEADWQTAWFIDPILAVYSVVNPFNYVASASDSAADRARNYGAAVDQERMQRVVHDRYEWAMEERGGRSRAARANYAAVETNVTAFLVAFAAQNDVEMIPILPCHGSPEVEARKLEIVAAGGTFTTDNCAVRR